MFEGEARRVEAEAATATRDARSEPWRGLAEEQASWLSSCRARRERSELGVKATLSHLSLSTRL